MSKTIKLIGSLRTLEPLQVSLPEHEGRLPRSANNQPYFPSSSIRGWLRNNVANVIAKIHHDAGKPLTVDEIYLLSSGVDTLNTRLVEKDGSVFVGINNELRKANPFLSLFGCWKFEGKLKVGNAYPITAENVLIKVGTAARGQVFDRNPKLIDFVDPNQLDRLEMLLTEDSKISKEVEPFQNQIDALKRKFKNATTKEKEDLNKNIKDLEAKISSIRKTREGSENSIRHIISGVEAIDAGVELSHRMTIANPSNEEITMLLWGLYCASLNNRLGGKGNIGCGEFIGHWDILEFEFGSFTPKKIASVTFDDEGFKLESDIISMAQIEATHDNMVNEIIDVTNYHKGATAAPKEITAKAVSAKKDENLNLI